MLQNNYDVIYEWIVIPYILLRVQSTRMFTPINKEHGLLTDIILEMPFNGNRR